jgi:predicted ATPase/DNA-binding SARP family transcriptional activator
MPGGLTATFFGGFEVRRNDEPVVGFGYDKVKAIFAYLVVEPAFPFNRDVLAGLFWPDQTEQKARHSLRQAISQLRSVLEWDQSNPLILTDRTTLQRNPQAGLVCDVYTFTGCLKVAGEDKRAGIETLENAVEIYQGELLRGLSLAQTESFEEWLSNRREHFHRQAVSALEKIVGYHAGQGNFERSRAAAEKWVRLEPWREEAHRNLMLSLARTGQRSAALKQYQLCCQSLMDEFGLLPAAETESLHRRILDMGSLWSSLPELTTPLIGRQDEMKYMSQLLADPQVRLVTITGPGGTGKTRLALQLGNQAVDSGSRAYLNGVAFISLDGLSTPEGIPAIMAQALSFNFHTGANPLDQLLGYLKDKEMLLILDNLEHLVGKELAGLVQRILDGARDIKILATSRQKLSLRSEIVLPLLGLDTAVSKGRPSKSPMEAVPTSSAVELFTTLLHRSRAASHLYEDENTAVVRICQLVEGMPLAIELAAALADSYSLPEIAISIQKSLDFLQAEIHDLPDRHRSIHAAVDASWGLLRDRERSTFKRLCLFRDGFTYQAATQVGGADRQMLSRLVNKSFLRYRIRSGRFEIHELLRQYGYEKLATDPGELGRIREMHAEYFIAHALSSYSSFFSPREMDILKSIEVDYSNILAAWEWAIEQKSSDLAQLSATLHHFYLRKSRFHEGIQAFQLGIERLAGEGEYEQLTDLAWIQAYQGDLYAQAVDLHTGARLLKTALAQTSALKAGDEQARRVRAFCLSRLGVHLQEEGDAQPYLEESLNLYRELEDKAQIAYVLTHIGDLHRTFGKFDESLSALHESLSIHRELGSDLDKVRTLIIMGLYAMRRGELEEIEPPLKEAVQIARAAGDLNELAIVLETFGIGYGCLGQFTLAEAALQESMQIRYEIDQRKNIVINHYLLALVQLHQGKYSQAKAFAQKSLQLAHELNDVSSNGNGYTLLGATALVEGSYDESRSHYERGIAAYQTGWQQDWQSRQGFAYAQLAILDCRQGYLEQARSHLQMAFKRIQSTQSYFGLCFIFPALSLYLVHREQYEQALEIYARVMSEPLPKYSAWFKAVAGQEIEKAVKLLNPRQALKHSQAGQARDLWQTAREYSQQLSVEGITGQLYNGK